MDIPAPYSQHLHRLLRTPSVPKLGLERMQEILRILGHPERAFKAIHIAGTKGKGSTVAFVSALLSAAGIRHGVTISPHLSCARERIQIDGEWISEEAFCRMEERVYRACELLRPPYDQPSFFEKMIAMAFLYFAEQQVPFAVVEVGLGGRYDATNVVHPVATGIAKLGLDHQEYLGNTIDLIAAEKAGIYKSHIPAFTVEQEPLAMDVVQKIAHTVQAPLTVVSPLQMQDQEQEEMLGLQGDFQRENAALALALVQSFLPPSILTPAKWRHALRHVKHAGRYELAVIDAAPDTVPVLLDGAHNPLSVRTLLENIIRYTRLPPPYTVIFSATKGHDPTEMLTLCRDLLAGQQARLLLCPTPSPRSASSEMLDSAARSVYGAVVPDLLMSTPTPAFIHHAADPAAALALAIRLMRDDRVTHPTGSIICFGSLYLVGALRVALFSVPVDPQLPVF